MALPTQVKFFLPAGLIFALVGLGFTVRWVDEFRSEDAFTRALITQGVVTGKRVETIATQARRSSYLYFVAYEYSIAGKPYKAEQLVQNQSTYASVERGTSVPVYYIGEEPGGGLIEKPSRGWMLLAMGGPFLLIGAGMLFVSVPGIAGAVAFGASSVIADGYVLSVSEAPLIVDDVQAMRVYYRFNDADGAEHRGFSNAITGQDAKLFTPGMAIKIRYRAKDPEESELVFDRQITID